MKDVDISFVKANLPVVQYAKRVVRVLNAYPVKDNCVTYQYQFRKQNPSKVSVPVADAEKLAWQADEENNLYVVIDGVYLREVNENGFKRLVSRKEKPAATATATNPAEGEVA